MPTTVVNTHEAESRLSELIRAAEAGGDVIVARNGQPVARIVRYAAHTPARLPGAWKDRLAIDDDALESDADIVAMFDASAEHSL